LRGLLHPTRQRGEEYLEAPNVDPRLVRRSLRDVTVANRLFGGTHAVLAEVDDLLVPDAAPVSLLDVGAGLADIPAALRRLAEHRGVPLTTFVLDESATLVEASSPRAEGAVRADARALPFARASVDIVTCSQVLHHFPQADAMAILREMHRVARRRVVVSDLRRSWIAAAGLWLASYPLRFHPVSRHDGVVSVLRGFSAHELSGLVQSATGIAPRVHRHAGYRITAAWAPQHQ
jgi:SAM-dependent methyltransferase